METAQTYTEQPSLEAIRVILRDIAQSQKETDRILRDHAEQAKKDKEEHDEWVKKDKEEYAERARKDKEEHDERARKDKEEHDEWVKKDKEEYAERMKKYDEQQAERMKKYDEQQAEQKKKEVEHWFELHREINRIFKESAKEAAENAKETEQRLNKKLGDLSSRFGEMVEYMVIPNLTEKFHEFGFVFEKAYKNTVIKDPKNNIFTEVDITLENGDKVMIVEVKSKPDTGDITDHIERMGKVKAHAKLHNDKRIFLGAIAGVIVNENEKQFALKNGFYVIEPSGETFAITAPEGAYAPREW